MTEGQEVDCVENIGLADAVAANHAINLWREIKCGLPDVFIVDERQFLQNHGAKV